MIMIMTMAMAMTIEVTISILYTDNNDNDDNFGDLNRYYFLKRKMHELVANSTYMTSHLLSLDLHPAI